MTDDDKLERIPLGRLENTAELIKETNEAIAVFEMRRALQRQAERDIVVEELKTVVNILVQGQVAQADEIAALRRVQAVLVRQQQEVRERQDVIAAVCDAFAQKLSEQAKTTSALVEHVTDLTEP